MRWMVDARTRTEKQGNLEMHSFVRAEIVASYCDDGSRKYVPAELLQSPAELLREPQVMRSNAQRHCYRP